MHGHGLFTILSEREMSSKRIVSTSRLTVVGIENEKKMYIRVLGVASWGRSPHKVKDPNLHAVRHDHRR